MIKSHKDSVIVSAHTTSKLTDKLLSPNPYMIFEHCDRPPKIPVVVLQVEPISMDYLLIEYIEKSKYIQPNSIGSVSLD